jgi:hypothetical protein
MLFNLSPSSPPLPHLTRVGFLHLGVGKTWGTRKESRQGSFFTTIWLKTSTYTYVLCFFLVYRLPRVYKRLTRPRCICKKPTPVSPTSQG